YEVQSFVGSTSMRIVNTLAGTCSCMYPNEFGLPCIHACAVIRMDCSVTDNFINNKRKIGALKQIYSGYISMVDLEQLNPNTVLNAVSERRRGRPRNAQRIRPVSEIMRRRRNKCSMCAQEGHDKRRCPWNPQNSQVTNMPYNGGAEN
ncbi:hypothetical protein ENBRE01_3327, partial [Enteropsectra breve]